MPETTLPLLVIFTGYGVMGNGYAIRKSPAYSTPQKLNLNQNIQRVEIGDGFTIFITKGRRVYGVGKNSFGQLGDGTNIDRSTFVLCTEL